MKSIRSVAAMMFFAVLFAVPALAQQPAANSTAGAGKVAVIDTGAFADEKAGITKYISAAKQLNDEFQKQRTDIQNMTNQYNTLVKEIETLSKPNPSVPVNRASLDAKVEQAEKLKRDIAFKQEDAQAAYGKRQQALIGPIFTDIGKAIQEYAKQKGYTVVLDLEKMAQGGMILAVDKTADVTEDFIKFYNARPAGTASTATPK